MTARVHVDLSLSEDGRRTTAELTRGLKVSAASASVAVNRRGSARALPGDDLDDNAQPAFIRR